MSRLNAAFLAGAVSVLLFAAAIALVNWLFNGLLGAAGFWRVAESRLFVPGVIVFNAVVMLPLVIWSVRRARRAEKDERLTPLHRWSQPINPRKF